ncbi:hypothetical protein GPUN_0889 [Glaciecola punicea ACAM 611]|uniref:Uncharacterized protein n=1 Tax=Glaciecola punicea ACAM 611 TaxID=1121923 RepID=H5T9P4_9ALTE|nr:hypothetical protein [Glaciecola punicea]GAB55021.1 hypothetical protein GPUN_0889 [Glaciecola punicea ACAM 611]
MFFQGAFNEQTKTFYWRYGLFEIYVFGVFASFLMAICNKVLVDVVNRLFGVYTYFQNLRKILPYIFDGSPFIIRQLKMVSLAILISLTSWIGFLFFLYTTIDGCFGALTEKKQFLTEDSKKYAMPLFNNPHLSREKTFAYKCMLDISNGYDHSLLGEAIYEREEEINNQFKRKKKNCNRKEFSDLIKEFSGLIAISELEKLDFFVDETIKVIRKDYQSFKEQDLKD